MFADASIPETAQAPAADAWAERELAILSELAEAGLEIAHALKTRIVETAAAEPDADTAQACADLGRAFDRTSRAVRLSIALRRKLLKEAAARPAASPGPRPESRGERADRVRRIVRRVLRREFRDPLTCEALDRRVGERLYDTDITGDLEGRSIGELVALICADLDFAPRWRELAEEAWARAEIIARPEGSPYLAWPDMPPEDPDPYDDDDPDPGGDLGDDPGADLGADLGADPPPRASPP
jgi:hypothetical protein